MSLSEIKVIVIGAGIGGLAAACVLRAGGARVTVLEQAPEITEVGAGLQISPNGFAVLQAIGLGDKLAKSAVQAHSISLRDYRKGEVVKLELGLLKNRNYFFVHRADLIDLLAAQARSLGVKVKLLQQVTEVIPGACPLVHQKNGVQQKADVIIGADGLHSVMRGVLNAQSAPQFSGQVAWRAVVLNTERRGPQAQVHMGPGRHLVSYPLRGGNFLNVVAVREQSEWAEESWTAQDDPENLQKAFADFGPDARAILSRVTDVRRWGLFRHPVADVWHKGGCALLGDAAHPTLPFLAQGANLALEDAWVLGDALSGAKSVAEGLANYQARRHARACKVIAAANGNAWKYHLRFGPLRMAAHGMLRLGGLVAPGRMMHQFDWLYDHDVTRES